ncbi:MAG: hypothetical protein ABFS86_20255, partial [Planctomycetota bacterium]
RELYPEPSVFRARWWKLRPALIFTDEKRLDRIRDLSGRKTTVVWSREGWRDVLVHVAGE